MSTQERFEKAMSDLKDEVEKLLRRVGTDASTLADAQVDDLIATIDSATNAVRAV